MARSAICQRSGITGFENATELDTGRLRSMCLDAVAGWRLEGASVRVRYSREGKRKEVTIRLGARTDMEGRAEGERPPRPRGGLRPVRNRRFR